MPQPCTPREVAERVRTMVAGKDGIVFADLFAADGVLAYPFAMPGQPPELHGREAIREFFGQLEQMRARFTMDGIEAVIRETDDPEVVVTEITHHGRLADTGEAYRQLALGVIRVRGGEIVRYDDYMNPLDLARLTGRTRDLAALLASS